MLTPVLDDAPGLRNRARGRLRLACCLLALAVAGLGLQLALAGSARADTAPVAPETTTTFSADALPTVQVDGVVWSQVVVGETVYVTGSFGQARPAGAAAGTNQTARANLLAYNLLTGALVTGWAPTLNAQGMTIAASPDGSRIYVGGDFTSANGVTRNRIAAFDAATGALVTGFAPGVNGRVRSIVAGGTTVYVGGSFSSTGGVARARLAAFAAGNGALLAWAPNPDAEVMALTAAGPGQIVAGGRFRTISGSTQVGMAALDATTGAARPWAVNQTIQNYGADAAIWSLSYDGSQVYGSGYGYLVHNDPTTDANLENTFAATPDGRLVWANGCLGDTYGQVSLNGALYSVGHPHNCSAVGGLPQSDPWTYQRAMATTTGRGPGDSINSGGRLNGLPAPQLLHWLPTLEAGSVTGQYQAAWSVTGTGRYLLLAGEFPSVNGTPQQGLVRFTTSALAPDTQGPQGSADLKPTLTSLAPGTVRVSWKAAWDRDNRRLSYELLRGTTLGSATVVATRTRDSNWWTRPVLAVTDRASAPGSSQTYRVRVTDPFGNTVVGPTTVGTVPVGSTATNAYADAVAADGATSQWRLGETSGATGYDWISGDDLTLDASTGRGAGSPAGGTDGAVTFTGTATVPASGRNLQTGPQSFSAEAWVKTSSTRGGKIIGFGDQATTTSFNYDRHIYLTDDGSLVFGTYPGGVRTVSSGPGYNDDKWHQVVATSGADGMVLYVDGKQVAAKADAVGAQSFAGYWRIGGDNLGGWPAQPSSSSLAGSIDEVAVYPAALSAATVQRHYALAVTSQQPQPQPNQSPTAAFTPSCSGLTCSFTAAGSKDPDGSITGYAWTFGDGATGTGVTTSRSYAAAGTYPVQLTVTDDRGATGVLATVVTVSAPASTTIAADGFGRAVMSGWSIAETGGTWTGSGASNLSVGGGVGSQRLATAGLGLAAALNSVSADATDTTVTVASDKVVTGNGAYVWVTGRKVGTSEYRGRARLLSGGGVAVQVSRYIAGTETAIGTETTVAGLTYAAGTPLRLRLQVDGTGTTTLRFKVWRADASEPAGWQKTGTDTTAGLQAAGGVGLATYLSGSSTSAPVTITFDDLAVTRP